MAFCPSLTSFSPITSSALHNSSRSLSPKCSNMIFRFKQWLILKGKIYKRWVSKDYLTGPIFLNNSVLTKCQTCTWKASFCPSCLCNPSKISLGMEKGQVPVLSSTASTAPSQTREVPQNPIFAHHSWAYTGYSLQGSWSPWPEEWQDPKICFNSGPAPVFQAERHSGKLGWHPPHWPAEAS